MAIATMTVPVSPDQLEVTHLSTREWLISDETRSRHGGVGVVAYIEFRFGVFELLELDRPVERSFFDTLEAAVAAVSGATQQQSRPVRDIIYLSDAKHPATKL